jgi:mitogen-activated protein kinase 15
MNLHGGQAYGIVWKVIDKKTRQVVALKKCFDAFRNATDAQRTFREIMYLQVPCGLSIAVVLSCAVGWRERGLMLERWVRQALAGHENIIRLQHVIKAENDRDIYLTFDHMGACQQCAILAVLSARRVPHSCSFRLCCVGSKQRRICTR